MVPITAKVHNQGGDKTVQARSNSKVNAADRAALIDSLSKIKRDITGDGQFNQDDMTKFNTLLEFMSQNNLTVSDIIESDVNNDGMVTVDDFNLISKAFMYVRDVNGDGKRDALDVAKVKDVVDYQKLKSLYKIEDINKADINGDGIISDTERAQMVALLNNQYDMNGDGVITQDDITMLTNILAYQRLK